MAVSKSKNGRRHCRKVGLKGPNCSEGNSLDPDQTATLGEIGAVSVTLLKLFHLTSKKGSSLKGNTLLPLAISYSGHMRTAKAQIR